MIYVQTDAHGLIQQASSGPQDGFEAVSLHDWQPGEFAERFYKNSEGFWMQRPALAPVDFDGSSLSITGCPAGTVVSVIDVASGMEIHAETADVDAWADVLTFNDAGLFEVHITPPIPWREERLRIEVLA